jgi:hypothetical protein
MRPGPLKTDMTAFLAWRRGARGFDATAPRLDPRW